MSRVNILIIEDEPYYASQFHTGLDDLSYNIIDVVDDANQALAAYYATEPDVVIINIKIRGRVSGLEIAEKISGDELNSKPIIFITDDQNLQTFQKAKRFRPVAYILKPFDIFSVKCAIELALNSYPQVQEESLQKKVDTGVIIQDILFVRKNKKVVKVPLADISYIEVESKYSTLVTAEGKFIVRISLKELLDKLPKNLFLRVHRNYIVNIINIVEFDFEEYTVHLKNFVIPIGRSYRNEIVTLLPFLS